MKPPKIAMIITKKLPNGKWESVVWDDVANFLCKETSDTEIFAFSRAVTEAKRLRHQKIIESTSSEWKIDGPWTKQEAKNIQIESKPANFSEIEGYYI